MPKFQATITKMGGVTALLVSTLAISPPVHALSYTIGWTGTSGYSLDGSFSFPDILANTGPITFASLTSFTFTTRLNGVALKTGTTANNFNFNTTTQTFAVGGLSNSSTGQEWGSIVNGDIFGNGAGFASGGNAQAIFDNGQPLGIIGIPPNTLTATPVPFEFSPALGLSVIGGAWFLKKYLGKASSK
jgi:hypothetical protein